MNVGTAEWVFEQIKADNFVHSLVRVCRTVFSCSLHSDQTLWMGTA